MSLQLMREDPSIVNGVMPGPGLGGQTLGQKLVQSSAPAGAGIRSAGTAAGAALRREAADTTGGGVR
ncbi:hypothetical protein, partial [Rubrivivax gelatinosus]|uniref:hypothetical protein n=1 Tax=Rubrivivax gelatinosus TaxID=28068 RepID=UPI003F78E82E